MPGSVAQCASVINPAVLSVTPAQNCRSGNAASTGRSVHRRTVTLVFAHRRPNAARLPGDVGDPLHDIVMGYDRLVLAAGSPVVRPNIPGLREFGFDVDPLAIGSRC
ncbi:hypothetical protein GCM10009632_28460 [Mycolicibacterium alvei]